MHTQCTCQFHCLLGTPCMSPKFVKIRLVSYGAFTLAVKSVLNENLGGILGGTQFWMGDGLMLSEC